MVCSMCMSSPILYHNYGYQLITLHTYVTPLYNNGICHIQGASYSSSKLSDNVIKNRYKDILPYDV